MRGVRSLMRWLYWLRGPANLGGYLQAQTRNRKPLSFSESARMLDRGTKLITKGYSAP